MDGNLSLNTKLKYNALLVKGSMKKIKKRKKEITLKVYTNKRTGQAVVMLPKKKMKIPKVVKIRW